ncbi:hypothetical protein [Chryseobacterium viscerum]|uniref:Uncharacterized protein n=1 Tax=Chryseobacterium viscerum TaxID=1037377 RepID=A0A316WE26_9FLAO|nr:hypothetical protein [Chryseobacterium viscerum]PWN58583.1 hypothetical protein C1634_021210 [Chryseobacterium viscerum]
MKNKFISRLLSLVTIMVLLYSCRNELSTEQETHSNSSQFRPTSKTIRLEQSKHKLVLKTELQKAQNNLTNIKTNASGKAIDYANGVSIDTDNVTYIEYGTNFHTYTFNLIRGNAPENAPLENLVLSYLPDGSYKELLVTYNFTPQEKQDLLSGKGVKTAGKATAIELAKGTYGGIVSNRSMGGAESCSYKSVDMYFSCYTGDHHSGNETKWGECNWKSEGGYAAQHITVVALVCTASTALGDDGSPGGGEIGPTTGLGGDTDTPTIPTLSTFFFYVKRLPADLKTVIYDTANTEFYDGLKKFYDFNSSQLSQDLIKWALQFKQNNAITWGDFQPMLTYAYNFLDQNPDTVNPEQIFSRQKDLNDALLQNSNLLLDIPCGELDNWKTVAQHNIPQSVKDKLQNIKNQTSWWSNWQITDLDDAAGANINMDLFPIQINSMPNKPNSTQKYTPEEFFNFFRLNLNLFAEKFTPIVDGYYGINDIALWNSSNPLGTLIHIEIPIDDGTVICSGFGPKAWVFSTIKAPMSMAYDGIHPVAGNRLFGYYISPNDNTMYIYTRGVDRVSKIATDSPNLANYIIENSAFFGADQLWKGMQDKLSKYINARGGSANKLPEKTYRPNYTKVKDYLKGKAPLSSLGCN